MDLHELHERQKWSLEQKIDHSVGAIEAFLSYAKKHHKTPYVSFSGGKDSTVLLDIVRRFVSKDIPAVFINTGNEYPEIVKFVKTFDNVEIIYTKKSIRQIIEQYGFPLISKEQSQYIYNVKTTKNKNVINIRMNGKPGKGRIKFGKINEMYKPLIDKPYMISHFCCEKLKKAPIRKYQKEHNAIPIIGMMASESRMRASQYVIRGGCNSFNDRHPASYPLSIWTDDDIWAYINKFGIKYCELYDMGMKRTGCMFCGFGANMKDDNRFEILQKLHPGFYNACMKYTNNGVTYQEAINDLKELGYGDHYTGGVKVVGIFPDGTTKEYKTIIEAANDNNVAHTSIRRCLEFGTKTRKGVKFIKKEIINENDAIKII